VSPEVFVNAPGWHGVQVPALEALAPRLYVPAEQSAEQLKTEIMPRPVEKVPAPHARHALELEMPEPVE
jgi:hypothetical protein